MDITDIKEFLVAALPVAAPVIYLLLALFLLWLIIEFVMTLRKTRNVITEVHEQIQPTLQSIERITASLEPAAAKVDPLVDRMSLTVDAANLEVMRLDKILEDVGELTDSVVSTAQTVDSAMNAPLKLATSISDKVRGAFKPRKASKESVELGEKLGENAEGGGAKPPFVEGSTHASTSGSGGTFRQGMGKEDFVLAVKVPVPEAEITTDPEIRKEFGSEVKSENERPVITVPTIAASDLAAGSAASAPSATAPIKLDFLNTAALNALVSKDTTSGSHLDAR